MQRVIGKKKESGAEGRKRRMFAAKDAQKSSMFLKKFLETPRPTPSTSANSSAINSQIESNCVLSESDHDDSFLENLAMSESEDEDNIIFENEVVRVHEIVNGNQIEGELGGDFEIGNDNEFDDLDVGRIEDDQVGGDHEIEDRDVVVAEVIGREFLDDDEMERDGNEVGRVHEIDNGNQIAGEGELGGDCQIGSDNEFDDLDVGRIEDDQVVEDHEIEDQDVVVAEVTGREINDDDEVEQIEIPKVIHQKDIGFLKFNEDTGKAILSDNLRLELIRLGPKPIQHEDGPFLSTNKRSMTKNWFKRRLGNGRGEEVIRSWFLYSPYKQSAFCFCCLLFSQTESQSSLERASGFSQWKAPERIAVHENSKNHRICFSQWKEMERNLACNGTIDGDLQRQIANEKQKWRNILTRVLHCIKYLAIQNLALRGHRENLGCDSNVGNFLGLLKLLAAFDPVLKQHLDYVESHPGSVSYLSPGVQNEFLNLMTAAVRQNLLQKIRKAKYYGLMFDTTPDQAHREQMSEVVRYVEIDFETKKIAVRESFLGFITISAKDAKSFVGYIKKQLEKDDMDLQDCRSQCYDNAAVMAGHKSGVHQRITELNNLAIFVNCDNHSLNLVGVHAAKEDVLMVTFFGTIEALYVFFSRSTQRWEKLKNAVPVVLKPVSETRWSARTEAVKPVSNSLSEILDVLQEMMDDTGANSDTRSDATQLSHRLLTVDFLTLLGFWNAVLIRIDCVQKRLQNPSMNFHDAALDMNALRDFFHTNRELIVNDAIEKGHSLCQEYDVEEERRRRRTKQMSGESSRDAGLTARQELERTMKGALDRINSEITQRGTRLQETDEKFGFLLDVEKLLYRENHDLQEKCAHLGGHYSCDVDGQELFHEISDCRMLLASRNRKLSKPEEVLQFIVEYGDESAFPNFRVALQILLTIAVSIASCERSFSKLKLILSYLRSSMGQERLNNLALLSIEREETEKTNFENIIDEYAAVKARKVHF